MEKKPMVKVYFMGRNSASINTVAEVCLDLARIRVWDSDSQEYISWDKTITLSEMHIPLFWFPPNQ